MTKNTSRPVNHLKTASEIYPRAWKQCDELRGMRGQSLPHWPAWCFLPLAGWYSVVSADAGLNSLPPYLAEDISRLAALGAWRVTQGIYQFDEDLQQAICDTGISGEIPVDVLLRLPEWSLYIETPGMEWGGSELYGFWVHLEHDANTERKELRLLLDNEDALEPVILHLGPWTVTEAVDRMASEAKRNAEMLAANMPDMAHSEDWVAELATHVQPLLGMVLYLCSDEPEVVDRRVPGALPQRPQPKRTKKGYRLFPPNAPRLWNVGDALGDVIRSSRRDDSLADSERKSPRPHLRRAHWHGYWTGPREGERKFIYRWLPPTPVAATE